MISLPSTDQVILDCRRELLEVIGPEVRTDAAKVSVQMVENVLRNVAARAAHEIAWMRDETDAMEAFARDALDALPDASAIATALAALDAGPRQSLHLADVVRTYSLAGDALSCAIEAAMRAGDADLAGRAAALLSARSATRWRSWASGASSGEARSMNDLEVRAAIDDALRTTAGHRPAARPSVAAAFHPGALLIDYGPQPLTIEVFVEHALASLGRKYVATQHRITNTAVERDGDRALVETYVHATHVEQLTDARRLHTFVGRYVDRFEHRDGAWRIAVRTLRMDWSTVAEMAPPMSAPFVPSGRAGAPDPIWD